MDTKGVSANGESGGETEAISMPGFRFHPTDEELVGYYLPRQLQKKKLPVEVIKQLDIYKYDPWDLPRFSTIGEREWYFFCPRDRKYRNSLRPNRVTESGFWKATGTDRPIYSSEGAKCIGLKKSLVFYQGRAAKGVKSDWMMHEFRLPTLSNDATIMQATDSDDCPLQPDGWAVCRILKKTKISSKRGLSTGSISASEPANKYRPSACGGSRFERENCSNKMSTAPKLEYASPSTGDDRITVSDDNMGESDSDGQLNGRESPHPELMCTTTTTQGIDGAEFLVDYSHDKPKTESRLLREGEHSFQAVAAGLQVMSVKQANAEGSIGNASNCGPYDTSLCSTPTSMTRCESKSLEANGSVPEMNQLMTKLESTNLSPSTRNTLELVNSILLTSPTCGDVYDRQYLNGQPTTLSDQSAVTNFDSDHNSGPNQRMPVGLSVQVPPNICGFLKNISPWDFSPYFVSPPLLQPLSTNLDILDMYHDV